MNKICGNETWFTDIDMILLGNSYSKIELNCV